MRYVPSIPPAASPVDTEGVTLVGRARPVLPVAGPAGAPIVSIKYRRSEQADAGGRAEEEGIAPRADMDRRRVCRRMGKERNKLLLLDSRAELERRRSNRRQADFRTNVDEEI